jgi:hypothetical protein
VLVVLNGCETLSLTLREEPRLRVFENRLQRRIIGPKSDEVTGEWRKFHDHDDHHLPPWIRSFDLSRHRRVAILSWSVHDLFFLEVCS